MGVGYAQTGQQGSRQAAKCHEGIVAKCCEQQIEPNHVGFMLPDCPQKFRWTLQIVERPAAVNRKSSRLRFCFRGAQRIGEYSETQKWILLQLFRNMESIFA
jgi:hypothetical protein